MVRRPFFVGVPANSGYLGVSLKGYYKDPFKGLYKGFLEFLKIRGTLGVPLKGYYKGTVRIPLKGSIRVLEFLKIRGTLGLL